MLRQLAFGGAISLLNIAIHAMLMATVVIVARRTARKTMTMRPHTRMIAIMGVTAAVLMIAHAIEVTVWATFYVVAGVAATADPFYFAFVNYTTLGYGDVLPNDRWLLIGPITAMNGVLLFGWSTAVLFDVQRNVSVGLPHDPPKAN